MRASFLAILMAAITIVLACAGPSSTQPPASGKPAAPAAPAQQPAAQPPAPGAQRAPAASAAPTPGPLRKVNLAYGFVGAEVIPMWLAFDQGTYQKYGLEVEATLMQSSAQIAPAMAAGDIDVALTAGAGVVDIDLAGGDQLIIAAHNNYMR